MYDYYQRQHHYAVLTLKRRLVSIKRDNFVSAKNFKAKFGSFVSNWFLFKYKKIHVKILSRFRLIKNLLGDHFLFYNLKAKGLSRNQILVVSCMAYPAGLRMQTCIDRRVGAHFRSIACHRCQRE